MNFRTIILEQFTIKKLQKMKKVFFYPGDGIRRSNRNDLLFRQRGDPRVFHREMECRLQVGTCKWSRSDKSV